MLQRHQLQCISKLGYWGERQSESWAGQQCFWCLSVVILKCALFLAPGVSLLSLQLQLPLTFRSEPGFDSTQKQLFKAHLLGAAMISPNEAFGHLPEPWDIAGCLGSPAHLQTPSSQGTQVTSCQHQRSYLGPHTKDRSHTGVGAILQFVIRTWPQLEITMKQEDKTAGEGRAISLQFLPDSIRTWQ